MSATCNCPLEALMTGVDFKLAAIRWRGKQTLWSWEHMLSWRGEDTPQPDNHRDSKDLGSTARREGCSF